MINGQMLPQSSIFAVVLTTQILEILSVFPNNYQKLGNVYFFEYEHFRFLFQEIMIFSPISGRLGIGQIL